MSKTRNLKKQLKNLRLGDLVCVCWFDASIGKSLGGANIDIPVKSWGIYLGVMGKRRKHIILAQNNFQYANGFFDIDYTAIPTSWANNVTVILPSCVEVENAEELVKSFLMGQRRSRIAQRKVTNHA